MSEPTDLNALPLPALFDELARTGLIRRLLELARDEDLGTPPGARPDEAAIASSQGRIGDITTQSWSPSHARIRAHVVAREPGVIAGFAAVPMLLELLAPTTIFEAALADGQRAAPRRTIATAAGPAHEVLALERTMLNLLSRLSGVATLTARYVEAIGPGVRARLYDTRKTTPGLRMLEKYAVRCGGGFCHRLGLYDAVLVKDNHLAGVPIGQLASRAADAARRARADRPLRFVEVEATRLEQVEALLTVEPGLIDLILLDNMTVDQVRRAVALRDRINPRIELEASGGVRLDTIREIAQTGVERISCGAITHSAPALDLALDAEE